MSLAALGALLGGVAGGFLVVGVTLVLKAGITLASGQGTWFALTVPPLGLLLAVLTLHGYGTVAGAHVDGARARSSAPPSRSLRSSPSAARSDRSDDGR
jgi:hypothetical protein